MLMLPVRIPGWGWAVQAGGSWEGDPECHSDSGAWRGGQPECNLSLAWKRNRNSFVEWARVRGPRGWYVEFLVP
jgi:hypothetical protein